MNTITPPSPKSHPRQPYELGIGVGFLAFTAYRWASSIIEARGVKVSQNAGKLLMITSGFTLILLLVDYLLSRWKLDTATRSGLWAAAAFGPYAGLIAWEELAAPAWSHAIGLAATIFFFVIFYTLERTIRQKNRKFKLDVETAA